MKRGITLIMIAAAVLLVAWMSFSGQGRSFEYNGTWEAHRPASTPPGGNPEVTYQASRVILTIKPDGTFDLVDAGYPHGGTIDVQGDHAVLTITTVLGQPMEKQSEDVQKQNKPIRLTPLPDGTMRYYDPGGFDQTGLIMIRQAVRGVTKKS